jgi:hypothetical protein
MPPHKKDQEIAPERSTTMTVADVHTSDMDTYPGFFPGYMANGLGNLVFFFQHWAMLLGLAVAIMCLMQAIHFDPLMDVVYWYNITMATFIIFAAVWVLNAIAMAWQKYTGPNMDCIDSGERSSHKSRRNIRAALTAPCIGASEYSKAYGASWEYYNAFSRLTWGLTWISAILFAVAVVIYRNRNNGVADPQAWMNGGPGGDPFIGESGPNNVSMFVASCYVFAALFLGVFVPMWVHIVARVVHFRFLYFNQ